MCERCGEKPAVEFHHKDSNPLNNDPKNIQQLCRRCHMIIDGRWAKNYDPEQQAAHSELMKAWNAAHPKHGAAASAKRKAEWADPKQRAARIAKIKAGLAKNKDK
jgi:hypothetical protein